MVQFTRAELRLAVVCVAASVGMAFSGAVLAAEAAAEEADELEEVQITGTRIQTPGVTSANPVDSITGEQMRQLGIVNVADALLQLVPQNVSTYSPFVSGDDQFETNGFAVAGGGLDRSSYFLGNTIANLRGLDPTFGTRTLTMVDGRRVVSTSNQADVVDLNIIPSNLLQRMDVVTGGASATYGSGAMAGVVNLVLNNRLTGFNLDMDYGINEAGDGSSPHISASGGMPLFGGKGHMLVGAEWQDQASIRNCAEARDWCRESRFMFTNGAGNNVTQPIGALPGFEEGYPGRFEMNNVRYSQFAPGSTIYHNSVNNPVGYRFELNPETNLVGVEEYAYGFRGGAGTANVMNGDGPLVTSGQNLRTGNNRKTLFGNFEFNITERTTAYLQTNYAETHATNKNAYTRGDYCVRFDQLGSTGQNADLGAVWVYSTPNAMHYVVDNQPYVGLTRTTQLNTINTSVQAFLGLVSTVNTYPSGPTGGVLLSNGDIVQSGLSGSAARGLAAPFWVPYRDAPSGPNFTFAGNATGRWVRVAFNTWDPAGTLYNPNYPENDFWLLESIQLTTPYDVVGGATILPSRGRNEYAFLNTLEPEALDRLQRSFVTGTTGAATVGAGAGVDTVYGTTPCSGFTAVRKVWNPQFDRWTEQNSETMRIVGGIKGRFGRDWRWDAYYQWGKTESTSSQNNVDTRLRVAFAMDAVIDDRLNIDGVANPNFGNPVCRITRDGVPVLDSNGRPLSDPEGLQALAAGCQPLNVFGTSFQTADAAALQQAALDYAFVESISSGSTNLQTLSFTTNGTLWQGWGAGPMTGAFGLEMRKNGVDNPSTTGDFWARSDLQSVWQDGFAGSTTTTEGSVEINLPLVSGVPGVNLWSVNSAVRYTSDKNKGGAGTTGQTTTKNTVNWKFQTVFEPFDWMRLRLSRSRDLRAPGYRDLFTFQPGIPDQLQGNNPWRERTAASTENQVERWGQVAVGNINLKPETSNTLTLGLVLSPSGWAQGMRFTADYFNIQVRDGIAVPFSGGTPMTACWEGSGNLPDQFVDGGIALDEDGNPFGRNGQFDYDYQAPDGGFPCQELSFAATTEDDPNAIQIPNRPGYYTLQDIVSYNSRRPQNSLPYQRRGIDFSLSYMFPLSRAFEELPGNLSLTIRATRALEASGVQLLTGSALQPVTGIGGITNTAASCQPPHRWEPATNSCYVYVDLTGQIRSGTFVPGVAASPLWTGNIVATYLVGDLTASLSARYIGGARLDKTWCDAEQSAAGFCNTYQNAQGQFLNGSVDSNWVKPYLNYSLNGSYNLKVGDMKQFQVFGSINNLLDKSPPYTGGGISGASAQYHDTMGRAYRMGVRLKF